MEDSNKDKLEVECVTEDSESSEENQISTTGGNSASNSSEQGSADQSVQSIFDLYENSIDNDQVNVTTKPAAGDLEDVGQDGEKDDPEDPCLEEKPAGPGPCRALIPRFYYDRWDESFKRRVQPSKVLSLN